MSCPHNQVVTVYGRETDGREFTERRCKNCWKMLKLTMGEEVAKAKKGAEVS